MKICLVTPAPTYSRKGNRVTALRWGRILRETGSPRHYYRGVSGENDAI